VDLTQALLFLCVCVQDVSFKFLPSLHAEFVLILSLVVIRMLHTTLSHADLWEKTDEFLLCLDGLRAGMDLARFTSPSWTDCMYKQSLLYKIRISQHSESSS
jgi:hypothetical protein